MSMACLQPSFLLMTIFASAFNNTSWPPSLIFELNFHEFLVLLYFRAQDKVFLHSLSVQVILVHYNYISNDTCVMLVFDFALCTPSRTFFPMDLLPPPLGPAPLPRNRSNVPALKQ